MGRTAWHPCRAPRLVFAANVPVAGAVGLASRFGGGNAPRAVWQASLDPASQPVRVVVLPFVVPWRDLVARS